MRRTELEHIIRAAADVTGERHLIVIGSQAVLGQFPEAPADLRVSMEADLYAPNAPGMSDFIDGALGRGSWFQRTHGIEADGVSPSTASLPAGWGERLVPIANANTNGATGWCLEVHDIAVSKYAAGREKDLRYIAALWRHAMIDEATMHARLATAKLKATDKPMAWIVETMERQAREAGRAGSRQA